MNRPNLLAIMETVVDAMVRVSCRHPRKVCAFFVLFAALSGASLPGLKIDVDTARMLDSSLDFRQTYNAFIEDFPTYDKNIVAVIDAPTAEQSRAARDRLAEAFRARSERFQDVQALSANPFFERYGVFLLSEAQVAQLAKALPAAERVLQTLNNDMSMAGLTEAVQDLASPGGAEESKVIVAERLASELAAVLEAAAEERQRPLSWRYLIWGEAPVLETVVTRPDLDYASLQPAQAAMAEARAIVEEVARDFDGAVKIGLTGQTPLETEELESATGGSALAAVLSFLLVSLVLGFGLRSWVLVAASLACLVVGLVLTAGFARVAIGELNLISVAFAVLFIGLSIDFSIHFSLRYLEACKDVRDGESKLSALRVCAQELGPALLLCAPTTALAFFSFIVTDFVGMAQLGLISGAGILIAMVISLTFLPALLTLMPRPAAAVAEAGPTRMGRFMAQVSRGPVVAVITLAIAASLSSVGTVRFNADTMALRNQDAPSVAGFFQLAERPETSPYALQLLVPPEQAPALAAQLEALPLVAGVRWLDSFRPTGMEEKRALLRSALAAAAWSSRFSLDLDLGLSDQEALEELAVAADELAAIRSGELRAPAEALAEALADFERQVAGRPATMEALKRLVFAHLPQPLTEMAAADAPAPEDSVVLPDELTRFYQTPDGLARLEVLPRNGATQAETAPDFVDSVKALLPTATGTLPEIIEAGRVVVRSMFEATAVASLAVALVLFTVLRSSLAVLLVLLPVAATAFLTVGAMALLGLSFNFANVIVIPLMVGLGIDSGIHLVMRARQSLALHRTSTPKAVLLSALTTIGSFGTLMVSTHRGTASMGELLALSISLLLLCSLAVLPWVLARRWLRGRY